LVLLNFYTFKFNGVFLLVKYVSLETKNLYIKRVPLNLDEYNSNIINLKNINMRINLLKKILKLNPMSIQKT